MKILVVCQHYYPEQFRITDICEELVRRGHEVTVVAGTPNYPMGKIYDGYRHGKKRDEVINGVKVHRCFEIGRRKGVLFRFLNYYSYAISSKRYVKRLKEKFDVVFANQLSPVMMANAAVAYKKKHGTKLVMYSLDLWPESLVVGGVKRGSFLYKHYHKVSKKIYSQADRLLITSRLFRDYFKNEFGIADEKIKYLPQYAEDMFDIATCKKEPNETVDLLFAGNVGDAQSVETIVKAAALTKENEHLRWHIVGDGIALEKCQNLAKELQAENVVFYGRRDLSEMPEFYKKADAMLVTLIDDKVLSLTLPGKVQTYMAAGKPIIGAVGGETAEVITDADCGYCGAAEDAEALAKNAKRFYDDVATGNAQTLGTNARTYYETHFTKELFFTSLENELRE
ncbi:MAG: glycosyltransferase family 4 protein [Clostridia bacterium]|nr:glycosyltransferase family 4 protein [Clostridia bacterium]